MATPAVSADETTYRGEPAVRLGSGPMSATFLPGLGLTGVSLRRERGEFLAVPGGLDTLRRGGTAGLPLVAPWVNRLARTRFRSGATRVDVGPALASGAVHADANGLPIHGLTPGRSRWIVEELRTRGDGAWMRASTTLDESGVGGRSAPGWLAFPFAHRLVVTVTVRDPDLTVDTTIVATGRRPVPVAFGWHPYLRLPGAPRTRWRLRMPARRHVELDALGIPTGRSTGERAERERLGRRVFDDLYALGRTRRLAFESDEGRSVELRGSAGYPFAQVWVPPGRPFGALEPMTSPTNGLVDGRAPTVAPGEDLTVTFTLRLDA